MIIMVLVYKFKCPFVYAESPARDSVGSTTGLTSNRLTHFVNQMRLKYRYNYHVTLFTIEFLSRERVQQRPRPSKSNIEIIKIFTWIIDL
jgi:hypothetical protein